MKHQNLVAQMTLEEKAAILGGKGEWQTWNIDRLGIPSCFCSDGPHGIRKQAGTGDHLGLNPSLAATCFPTAATVANSWDPALGEEIGKALGEEACAQGVDILLGPGLNIKRSPLCGRNFEYFSEDPYLAGKMAAGYIRGIQSQKIVACPKHFAVNSQELRRMAMNAVIDERTMREIYLTGFEIAIKEGGAKAIMTSYNEINGIYANENAHLLQEILREEWGFEGAVITDWGGSNDHVKGVLCGSNLEMPAPGLESARELLRAIEDKRLTVDALDACVDTLLDVILASGEAKDKEREFSKQAHHELARDAAAKSAVLLKNEEGILPLAAGSRIAVIGDFAMEPRYQGAGSSLVNPTMLESIEKIIGDYDLQVMGMNRGYRRDGEPDAAMRKAALDLAASADIVLYFFGLNEISESEGLDRTHMRIPQNQIALLEAIVHVNANIVGVISAGSAVEMPWHYHLSAILHGYLGGQAGAGAIMDILTGKVNPSGRLSETYPLKYEDTPAFRYFPGIERNAEYRESLFVGYRYYDTSKVRVLYPFGYGLSYTSFTYSDLTIDEKGVVFTVTNTGGRDGAETPQLYVGLPGGKVFRPQKELKGFRKIFLQAGTEQKVRIPFDDKTFRYWNVKTGQWEIEEGEYQIFVGACVADIRLMDSIKIKGTTDKYPYKKENMASYYAGLIQKVGDEEFTALLGTPIPDGKWRGELGVNDAICQMYYAKSSLARLIYHCLTAVKKRSEKKGKLDLNILFIYNMPFRAIAKMTGGAVSMQMVYGMVDVVNGHFVKGMKQVITGFLANARANKKYKAKLEEN